MKAAVLVLVLVGATAAAAAVCTVNDNYSKPGICPSCDSTSPPAPKNGVPTIHPKAPACDNIWTTTQVGFTVNFVSRTFVPGPNAYTEFCYSVSAKQGFCNFLSHFVVGVCGDRLDDLLSSEPSGVEGTNSNEPTGLIGFKWNTKDEHIDDSYCVRFEGNVGVADTVYAVKGGQNCGYGSVQGPACGDVDQCPNNPDKTEPGVCGCDVADTDTDHDNTPDCHDECPTDANKVTEGQCGCFHLDTDSDNDGTADCHDECPTDEHKTEAGECGCFMVESPGCSEEEIPRHKVSLCNGEQRCDHAIATTGTGTSVSITWSSSGTCN